jgi:hypothetical protein
MTSVDQKSTPRNRQTSLHFPHPPPPLHTNTASSHQQHRDGPVKRHVHPVPQRPQPRQVGAAPRDPRGEAGEGEAALAGAAELEDGAGAADGGHGALVLGVGLGLVGWELWRGGV